MKIFDYKFIILLGLTIILYLIYREVNNLNNKVNNLNTRINQLRANPLINEQRVQPSVIPQEVVEMKEVPFEQNDNLDLSVASNSEDINSIKIINLDLSGSDINEDSENATLQQNNIIDISNNFLEVYSNEEVATQKVIETQDIVSDENILQENVSNEAHNMIVYDEKSLKKMTVVELKNIATSKNIILMKNVDGVQKSKGKNDLIKDILGK